MRERMDRLEEALEMCHLMFTEERPSFEGTYYRLDRALNNPRPIQSGGPKILIGGSGERRTLRMVARFGDISNWFGGLDELKHKNEVFLAHCEAVGRDPSTVTRTVMAPVLLVSDPRDAEPLLARIPPERRGGLIAATPADAAEALAPYREAGFDGFILRNPMLSTVESMALAGELIALMH
jgi:alkanesulfonate monooxygenase SsuD/methylene tetrahydromethanopterin reductase-like flavin-dependent oxidoreductase (luciferase family)